MKTKFVKSINQRQSVLQTMDDIVMVHGGGIQVETGEGDGTTFKIIIPVQC